MRKGVDAEELRTRLQKVDPYEFEYLVADLWEARGWDSRVSNGSNDLGVDVEATKSGEFMDQKAVIQAKRYSDGNKVGRPKIQQYHSLKQQDPEADVAVVVTTSGFTDGARLWARDNNVKLVDGEDLVKLIEKNDQYELVEEYAPKLETGEEDEEPDYGRQRATSKERTSPSVTKETSNSPSSSSEAREKPKPFEESDYFSFVALLAAGQIAGVMLLAFPESVPAISGNQAAGLFSLAWIGQPVAVFADAIEVHQSDAEFKPNRFTWPMVVLFVPLLGALMYVKKRMG